MARKGRSKKDLNIDYAKLGLWVVVGISLYIGYSALETWLVSGEERTHYDVLGVARDASDSDIKRAYRKLALTLHPDKNPDCAECEAEFALVSKAYKVLSDPGKRRDYNAHLVAKARGLQEEENRVESRAEELHDSQYDELFGAPKREDLVDPKAKDADLGEHTGIMWTAPNVWLVQGYLHMSEMVWYFSEEWENLVSMLEGYIRVARVNVDKEERLAKVFYSPRVPTVFLVINGNVRVYSGALTAQAVLRWVTSLFDEMLQPLTTSKQALSFLDGAVERPRALWVTRGGRAIREADMWRRTLASRFHGLVDSAELAARPQEARKREEFESEEEEASYRSQLRWLKRRPYAETSEAKALLAEVGATAADTPLLVISRGAGAPLTLCKRVRKRDDAYGCLYPNRYTVPMPVLTSSSANDLCGDRSCVVYLPEKGVAASTLEIVGKAAMEEKKRVVLAPTRDSAWPAQLRGAVVQWQVGVSSVCPARVQDGDLTSAVARLLDRDCEEDVPLPSKMKLMAPAVQASLDRHPYYSAIILGTILLYIATVLFGCKRINDIGKTKRFFAWRRNAVQAMIDREGIDR